MLMFRSLVLKFKKLLRVRRNHQLIFIVSACLLVCCVSIVAFLFPDSYKQSDLSLTNTKPAQTQIKHSTKPNTQTTNTVVTNPAQPSSTSADNVSQSSADKSSGASTPSNDLDFTLSTSSVTVQQGSTTPTITAKTVSGTKVEWLVVGPPAQQSYISIAFGIVSGASSEASHSFALATNPTETPPGTYTGTVTAYLPGHPSSGVTKTFIVTVLPQSTFTVTPSVSINNSYSPNDEACLNFSLQWTLPAGTSPQPVTATAYVSGTSPTDKVVSVNITGTNGCILVQFGSVPENNSAVRFSVSDATYSTGGTIYYSVL